MYYTTITINNNYKLNFLKNYKLRIFNNNNIKIYFEKTCEQYFFLNLPEYNLYYLNYFSNITVKKIN